MNENDQSPVIVLGKSPAKSSASPTRGEFSNVKGRLGNIENLTRAVLWVGVISVIGVVITSCALIIDQMHFNNQTYREQSDIRDLQFQELTKKIDVLNAQIDSLKSKSDKQ